MWLSSVVLDRKRSDAKLKPVNERYGVPQSRSSYFLFPESEKNNSVFFSDRSALLLRFFGLRDRQGRCFKALVSLEAAEVVCSRLYTVTRPAKDTEGKKRAY